MAATEKEMGEGAPADEGDAGVASSLGGALGGHGQHWGRASWTEEGSVRGRVWQGARAVGEQLAPAWGQVGQNAPRAQRPRPRPRAWRKRAATGACSARGNEPGLSRPWTLRVRPGQAPRAGLGLKNSWPAAP